MPKNLSALTNRMNQYDSLDFLRCALPTSFSCPLAFFDPQYRSVLDKLNYGNEGERQKGRAALEQMTDDYIQSVIHEIEKRLTPSGHLMLWVDKNLVLGGWKLLMPSSTAFELVDMITWEKSRIGMGYRSRRKCEYLMVLQKPPKRAKGVWKDRGIPDVWFEKVVTKNHPHAKPLSLQARLIESVTEPGDYVLDPCAGSYTVFNAAACTGRNFIGCDLKGDFPCATIASNPPDLSGTPPRPV